MKMKYLKNNYLIKHVIIHFLLNCYVYKRNIMFKSCLVLLIPIFLLYLIACHKNTEQPSFKPADITGSWDWIYTRKAYALSDSNPVTPENSGVNELLVFNQDLSWFNKINNKVVDSGTYSIGHGEYTPYIGAYTFVYDSIKYYRNGKSFVNGFDYYLLRNDTLIFGPYLGARFFSYTLPFNGEKCWIKHN
jgi:hypothetical protein